MILLWIQASPKTQGATELTEKSYDYYTFLFSNETKKNPLNIPRQKCGADSSYYV